LPGFLTGAWISPFNFRTPSLEEHPPGGAQIFRSFLFRSSGPCTPWFPFFPLYGSCFVTCSSWMAPPLVQPPRDAFVRFADSHPPLMSLVVLFVPRGRPSKICRWGGAVVEFCVCPSLFARSRGPSPGSTEFFRSPGPLLLKERHLAGAPQFIAADFQAGGKNPAKVVPSSPWFFWCLFLSTAEINLRFSFCHLPGPSAVIPLFRGPSGFPPPSWGG